MRYTIKVTKPEYWQEIHDLLCKKGSSCLHIPGRAVVCTDEKLHSPTRGTFELEEHEAEELKLHGNIEWVELCPTCNPDNYPKPEPATARFGSDVKIYRDLNVYAPPGIATAGELNRTTWSVPRTGIATNGDFWANVTGNPPVKFGDVTYTLTGANVDIVIHDSGILQYHPEFLKDDGTSRVSDIVLDGPYYIDPDYFNIDTEYNNGGISSVTGDGSDFFKREVTTNGVRIMGAGTVGGQTAVPDAWLEKVARMVELFTDVNGAGINETSQRNLIKTLSGDSGTYHAGKPTIQRVARGAGADYTPNFLTDQGIIDWNLTNLYNTTVQNDMVWYLNSTGSGYGDGDQDAQEVIEHVFHTLHMHGLPADTIKLYSYLASDWQTGDLYAAMEEAYDGGFWDSSGYGGNTWKTDADAFEVAAKEYLYLLNFCMFEYTSLWENGSLSPEWSDSMRTQAGIQANNPLGYAFHNTYIAPVISKPSLVTIRSIFQDGNTPAQDDPSLAGASGYVVDIDLTYTKPDGRTGITTASAEAWWENGANRSAQFASIGTVAIPASYTAARAVGDRLDGVNNLTSSHGTACASLAAGKTYGLAFEANLWNLPGIADNVGMGIEANYDLLKIFHANKPVNPITNVKNPTVCNGSWGYQAAFYSGSIVSYKFRGSTGTFNGNAATTDQVTAMKNGLYNQVSFAYKSWSTSSRSNSTDTAGKEAMDAGVIYVAAAGNNNQRLGIGAADPDRLNYMSDAYFGTTDPRVEFPTGTVPCNHRDWMNPQGIGFDSATDFHPVICVGAMDEFILSDYKERQAFYSNNGPGIDLWAPADETIGATANGLNQNYQRWDDTRFYDRSFNGTSAASPVAAGLIALYMESFPTATSRDVKNWLNSHATQEVGTDLYQDQYSDDTTTTYWTEFYNLRGASTRIAYNPYTVTPPAPTPPVEDSDVLLAIQGSVEMTGITINSQ